jgi:hypothetical protein
MGFALLANSIGAGTTGAIDTTGATFIVATVAAASGVTPVVSDNKSNTPWVHCNVALASSGSPNSWTFYINPTSVGSGHTFSATGSESTIAVQAYSGGAAYPDVLDDETKNSAFLVSSLNYPSALTPSQVNCLLVAAVTFEDGSTPTIDSSFNRSDFLNRVGGVNKSLGMAYQIQTTATARNPTWSWAVSNANAAAVLAVFRAVASTPANVARYANGGDAVASSEFSSSYPAISCNNGSRTGDVWGGGGGWNSGSTISTGVNEEWVQITFAESFTIDTVKVYTLQDSFGSPSEPDDVMTFGSYGVTSFAVQTWNGSSWDTQASVTGNNLVKRTITFAPVATTKVRVLCREAADSAYARLVEIEAFQAAATGFPVPLFLKPTSQQLNTLLRM